MGGIHMPNHQVGTGKFYEKFVRDFNSKHLAVSEDLVVICTARSSSNTVSDVAHVVTHTKFTQ